MDGSSERRQQSRGNKLLQPLQSAMFRAHKERNQERDEQQSPKPFWCAKGHWIVDCRLQMADCGVKRAAKPPHSKSRRVREILRRWALEGGRWTFSPHGNFFQ